MYICIMQKKWYGNLFKLGVLGGGQLGRMLIQEAVNFDVQVHCLDPDEFAPCHQLATSFTRGCLNDFDAVYAFGKDKDLLTIEIEKVNCDALQKLTDEGVKVYPQPAIIRLIQDKGLQKEFYRQHGFPTAPFRLISNQKDLAHHRDFLPFVQKKRTGGYDGKGVQTMTSPADFEKGFDAPSVLEKFVDFEKELAVIVSRNERGELAVFSVVECEFNPVANLVEFLFSPATISTEIENQVKEIAKELIQKLGMVGLLAVEFFLDKSGQLFVNEIAPRPHNSGHHTIECNITSQFEQLLRSILNLPLGSTELIQPGVMINLLGENTYEGKVKYEKLEEVLKWPGVKPHIYGKANTKPNRKMGHVTIVNKDLEAAKNLARKVQKTLKVIS